MRVDNDNTAIAVIVANVVDLILTIEVRNTLTLFDKYINLV